MDITKTRSEIIFLSLILIVAACLRFDHITQPFTDQFNWRQASTAMMAQNFYLGNWNIFYPEVSWTGPGPGYQGREFQLVTYAAALLYKLTGPADWVGRGIVALAGVWGVFALFALMDVTIDRRSALFGAALLAVFPGAIFIERSFLPDGVMTSIATTSLWMWARFCQSGRRIFLYSAVAALSVACLVKLQAFTVMGPAIYLLGLRVRSCNNEVSRAAAPSFAELGLLIFVGGAAVVSYYAWSMHLAAEYPPHHYAGEGKFIWDTSSIADWINQKYYIPEIFNKLKRSLTPLGLILAIASLLCFRQRFLVFHWWFLFWLIDVGLEAEHLATDPYNLSIINPIAAGLGGLALGYLSRWAPARLGTIGIVLSMGLVGGILLSGRGVINEQMWGPGAGRGLHELGVVLKKKAEPGDLVVSIGLNPLAIYYSGLKGWVFPPAHTWGWQELARDSLRRIEVLEDLERDGATWLVAPTTIDSSVEGLSEHTPILWNYVVDNYELVYESPSGRILRFREHR